MKPSRTVGGPLRKIHVSSSPWLFTFLHYTFPSPSSLSFCSAAFSVNIFIFSRKLHSSTSLNHHFGLSLSLSLSLPATSPRSRLPSHASIPLQLRTFPPASPSPNSAMAPPPPLKAVTVTHVRYQRGDPLGHFLAWISLVPVFISLGGFVSHFIFRRELQGIFFFLGLLVSQFISEYIKAWVQQARPETCLLLEMCDSHGWPSSHSSYMFFFATYYTLLTYRGIGLTDTRNKPLACFLPWCLAVLTMYSRVYLGYHTIGQVFAGATLGSLIGCVWFWLVNSVFCRYFPAIEESALGRRFYLKDTSHIPNVLKFEYDNARAARKNMDCKSN